MRWFVMARTDRRGLISSADYTAVFVGPTGEMEEPRVAPGLIQIGPTVQTRKDALEIAAGYIQSELLLEAMRK